MSPDAGGPAGVLADTAATLLATPEGVAAAALVVLAAPVRSGLVSFLVWIAAGAGAVGAVGWVAGAFVLTSVDPVVLFGAGLAVGGGIGAGARFLAADGESTRESVTVDMAGEERPDPQPADLFEASPDPILYYDDTGEGPVVRAVNPAFEETFGVPVDAVAGAAVADGLMATERVDRLLEAVADGDGVEETVACETPDGTARFRVRVAAVGTDRGVRGYVLYTPV